MEFGTCFECNIEMESETSRGRLYLRCPSCGRRMLADDWYEEYYDTDSTDDSEHYCRICEHSDEYPSCTIRCPYDED